jgi:hypothetical protein
MSQQRVRVAFLMYMTDWERFNNRPTRFLRDLKLT